MMKQQRVQFFSVTRCILQWDAHSPQKICPFPLRGSEPCIRWGSNTWFPGPTPSPQPKRQLNRCSRFCRAH